MGLSRGGRETAGGGGGGLWGRTKVGTEGEVARLRKGSDESEEGSMRGAAGRGFLSASGGEGEEEKGSEGGIVRGGGCWRRVKRREEDSGDEEGGGKSEERSPRERRGVVELQACCWLGDHLGNVYRRGVSVVDWTMSFKGRRRRR